MSDCNLFRQVLVKCPNTIFCENPFSGFGVVTCRHDEAYRHLIAILRCECATNENGVYRKSRKMKTTKSIYTSFTILKLIIYPTAKLAGLLFYTSHVELLANVTLLSSSNSLCSICCCCHALNINPHNADHKKNTSSFVRRVSDRHTERRLTTCVLNNTHTHTCGFV